MIKKQKQSKKKLGLHCISAVLSNLESRVCVVTKLSLCPGQGEPSSGDGSSFLCCCSVLILWAPKVLFYRRWSWNRNHHQPLLRRLLCPREWEGDRDRLFCDHSEGLGEQLGVAPAETGIRCPPVLRLTAVQVQGFFPCSAPCSWFPQNNLGFLSYLALLVFAQFFSACLAFFWNLFFLL